MSNAYDIIIRPVMTEKTTGIMEDGNKVVFRVKREASKPQIRAAVEKLFGVRVRKVNTMIMPGHEKRFGRHIGRTRSFKKAIVTLREGETLDLFAMEGTGEDHGVV